MFAGVQNFVENKSNVNDSSALPRYDAGSLYRQFSRFRSNSVLENLVTTRFQISTAASILIFALMGCYVEKSGWNLSTFQDNLSVPSSRTDPSSWYHTNYLPHLNCWPLKLGPIGCPETSVNNYKTIQRNVPEEPWFLGKLLTTDAGSYPRIKVWKISLWDCHILYNSLHFTSLHRTTQ
jgi:hypothetical protein